jgi:hypothetical protein
MGKISNYVRKKWTAWRFARHTKVLIMRTMWGVGQEASETKDMAKVFFRMLQIKLNIDGRTIPPTKEEVEEAIEQLVDVGRFSIFSIISIIPGGGASLIALEILARKLGVSKFTLVPSAFRTNERKRKIRKYKEKINTIIDTGISLPGTIAKEVVKPIVKNTSTEV